MSQKKRSDVEEGKQRSDVWHVVFVKKTCASNPIVIGLEKPCHFNIMNPPAIRPIHSNWYSKFGQLPKIIGLMHLMSLDPHSVPFVYLK